MNEIKAKVKNIQEKDFLNVVEFQHNDISFYMMGLELPDIENGDEVLLSVKPAHISLSKEFPRKSSISNIMFSKIKDIKNGEVLSSVVIEFEGNLFESIITSQASRKLNLQVNDEVYMLVKSSDLFIKRVIR